MKEKSGNTTINTGAINTGSLNPDNMELGTDQFITGAENPLPGTGSNPAPEQEPPRVDQNAVNIPDLHNTGETPPTAEQRNAIGSTVDTVALKKDILEEKISQEIEKAKEIKQSELKIDKTKKPKDVLKMLIAKGDYSEIVEKFGAEWKLRALDHRDILLSFDSMRDDIETNAGRLSALMYSQVLASIDAINDSPLSEWFDEVKVSDYESREAYMIGIRRALKTYMDHMPSKVIDELYAEYKRIEEKRNLALDDLKN